MKTKTIFSLVFMLFAYVMQAQSNEVEIYTADSKLFTVFIDGQQINNTPLSNVKFTSNKSDNVDFKIVFEENNVVLEKKAVQMISNSARTSVSNGAKIAYQLTNNKGTYALVQTSISNRASNPQAKLLD